MEETDHSDRRADGAESADLDGADIGGGGDHRRLPQTHSLAVGRLPLRVTGDDPASDALVTAPLFAKAWDRGLPDVEGDKPDRKKFKAYPIGFFHIDIAEVRTQEGKLSLFVANDRTAKIAFAELEREANRLMTTAFLEALIEAIPIRFKRF